jgi:hypothetical protein
MGRITLQKILHAVKVLAVCEKTGSVSQTEKSFVSERKL